MAKKKSNQSNKNSLTLIVLLLGIISTVILALKSFNVHSSLTNNDYVVNGLKVAFGGSITAGSLVIATFKFNLIFTLILLLPVIAGLVQLFLNNKLGSLISIILFVVAIVLLLTTREIQYTTMGEYVLLASKIKLQPIGYISLVTSIFGAGLTAYKMI